MCPLFDPQREREANRRAARYSSLRAIVVLVTVVAAALVSLALRWVSDDLSPALIRGYGIAAVLGGILFGVGLMRVAASQPHRRRFFATAYLGIWVVALSAAFGLRSNDGFQQAQNNWLDAKKAVESAQVQRASSERVLGDHWVQTPRGFTRIDADRRYELARQAETRLQNAVKEEQRALSELTRVKLPQDTMLVSFLFILGVAATIVGTIGSVYVTVLSPGESQTEGAIRDQRQQKETRLAGSTEVSDGSAANGIANMGPSTRVLDIMECPACKMRVIPNANGRCPSCQNPDLTSPDFASSIDASQKNVG